MSDFKAKAPGKHWGDRGGLDGWAWVLVGDNIQQVEIIAAERSSDIEETDYTQRQGHQYPDTDLSEPFHHDTLQGCICFGISIEKIVVNESADIFIDPFDSLALA